MTASALSFYEVLVTQWVWIDVLLFLVFVYIHGRVNWTLTPSLPVDTDSRQESFTFTSTLATGSVTAVGILLPLSLAAVGTFITRGKPSDAVLVNVFIADLWLALALAFCLLVLW